MSKPSNSSGNPSANPRRSPVIIGIAGASGCGKTTLAAAIARAFEGLHFPIDNYYVDLSHLDPAERAIQNFDDPALIECDLLARQISELAQGNCIERPIYDFATHTRVAGKTESVCPSSLILVEGLFALAFSNLRPHYHLKIYVETNDEICFERRLKRDILERGRTSESVHEQYEATVRPSAFAFIRPTREFADLIVEGVGSLDWKVEQIVHRLRELNLFEQAQR